MIWQRFTAILALVFVLAAMPASATFVTLTGAGKAGAVPKVLTYQTNDVQTSCTTCTSTGVAIGTATSDRIVHVGISQFNTAGGRTISSVTVGGIGASASCALASSSGSGHQTAIYSAAVPTGTTANVVVTWSGSVSVSAHGIWSSTGLSSASALNSGNTASNGGTITLTTVNGGFAIAATKNNGSGATPTWTGVTQKYYASSTNDYGGASDATTGSSTNVSISTSGGGPTVWSTCAASW